jgi:hypothetical protein
MIIINSLIITIFTHQKIRAIKLFMNITFFKKKIFFALNTLKPFFYFKTKNIILFLMKNCENLIFLFL